MRTCSRSHDFGNNRSATLYFYAAIDGILTSALIFDWLGCIFVKNGFSINLNIAIVITILNAITYHETATRVWHSMKGII